MFLMFKNFIIYLNILLCTCTPLPDNNEVPSPIHFEHAVQMELSPIKEKLNKIMNSLTNTREVFELGQVQGLVQRMAERAVKADILLAEKARLQKEKEIIVEKALKTFVVPYMCRNFELYEKVWDSGGKNSDNFDPDVTVNTEVKCHDLDTQTMSNYKHHAKIWDRILTSSTDPLPQEFKRRIQLLYPGLNLQAVAKNIGLACALLNNAKRGALNDEPDIAKLVNLDDLVVALKGQAALKNPVVLNIIKTFEQVVSWS